MLEYEEDEWTKEMREATMRNGLLLDQQVKTSEKLRESMTSLINSNNSVVRAQKDMMLQQETANQRVNMLIDTVRNLVDAIKRQSINITPPIQNKSKIHEEVTEQVQEEADEEKNNTEEKSNKEIEFPRAVKRKMEPPTKILPKRAAKSNPRKDPNFVYQATLSEQVKESEECQIYRSVAEIYRDPVTYKSAMNSKESQNWQAAVNEELKSMEENNVWSLVERPPRENIIDSRWVFKRKVSPTTETIYRARLVVRGFKDTNDYEIRETYAPVSRMTDLMVAIVRRCSTWEGVLATTRCHHLVAGRARVEQRELGVDEANSMAHESTLSIMRAPRLPHSSTSRQRAHT
uniref:Reverse transcriptase Ty1/copia-type domain-containing protein n=1 Tax=Trichogramma kaykai TaxID=54128 RepID=A0ABD2W9N2_9HYME